jgi:hypothetical protein
MHSTKDLTKLKFLVEMSEPMCYIQQNSNKGTLQAVFMYMVSLTTGSKGKVKANFIPEQAMKTQMGSSSIAILSL